MTKKRDRALKSRKYKRPPVVKHHRKTPTREVAQVRLAKYDVVPEQREDDDDEIKRFHDCCDNDDSDSDWYSVDSEYEKNEFEKKMEQCIDSLQQLEDSLQSLHERVCRLEWSIFGSH